MHTLKPRLSEKAFGLSQTTNTFIIDVPTELNKHEVADIVEKQFEVKVASVRLVNRKGKAKRVMNTSGRRSSNRKGSQADVKKAYITLDKDSHLPFFEAAEAEVKAAEKQAKKAESKKSQVKVSDEKKPSQKKKSVVSKLTGRGKKEAK